ncbi:MAG: hypothetical protein ACTSPP_08175 [Candidatus Heimdallarchaeaceae archaeon]
MPNVYTILVADSSLETFPSELLSNLPVRNFFRKIKKKPSDIILDSNYHSCFMSNLPNLSKRGRPDIPHLALLACFGSLLSQDSRLRVFIHTINDLIIEFHPSIRLPKNLDRFKGLMIQLFKEGRVPPLSDEPLLTLRPQSLTQFLISAREKHDLIVEFSQKGDVLPSREYAYLLSSRCSNPLLIFGGFSHGHLNIDSKFVDYRLSIYPHGLELFSVISHVLATLYNFEEEQNVNL